jgi:hypothetical protein
MEDHMKVGDIVYSIYPRIHGKGHGIVLEYYKGSSTPQYFHPSRAKVYWVVTGKKVVIRMCDLYVEEEQCE